MTTTDSRLTDAIATLRLLANTAPADVTSADSPFAVLDQYRVHVRHVAASALARIEHPRISYGRTPANAEQAQAAFANIESPA